MHTRENAESHVRNPTMVFSRTLTKILFLYTEHADNAEFP